MIKQGLVCVNDIVASAKYLLVPGDSITITEETKKFAPKIDIIFEDDDILVIDKPAGITAHPAPGENDLTVSEVFATKYISKPTTDRDMVVHRLDKGTSGVMVLAKNEKAKEVLAQQFANRKVNKVYTALVHGRVIPEEGIIDMPLSRDIVSKNRMAPADEGKDAKTLYKVSKYYQGFTLVTANPKTGRTHQIRVHFSAIGHPLYGDSRYGSIEKGAKRIFLHATQLSLTHPTTSKRIKFNSALPTELKDIISKFEIE